MTPNERKLFASALTWYVHYRRSNPDVGMGPMARTLVMDIEKETGVQLTPGERRVMEAIAAKENE